MKLHVINPNGVGKFEISARSVVVTRLPAIKCKNSLPHVLSQFMQILKQAKISTKSFLVFRLKMFAKPTWNRLEVRKENYLNCRKIRDKMLVCSDRYSLLIVLFTRSSSCHVHPSLDKILAKIRYFIKASLGVRKDHFMNHPETCVELMTCANELTGSVKGVARTKYSVLYLATASSWL